MKVSMGRRRSCVDAVAVLIRNTQQAWNCKNITGALLMDVKSAFNNVSRGHFIERMLQLEVEHDLVRWTESFMSERKVRLVTNGQEGEDHDINTGIPQGSPVSPILFAVCLSGLFGYVEDKVASRRYPSSATWPGWRKAKVWTPSAPDWKRGGESSPGVG